MKKTVAIIIMLILALIVLTGCSINVDYKVDVNKDGSGKISYIYAYSKETLESLQVKAENMVASMKEQAEENGYETEVYSDDEMEGFIATKEVENLKDEMSFQNSFGEQYVKDGQNMGILVENGLLSTKVSQKCEIDLTPMDDNMKDILKISYTVNLPVKASKNNATKISNHKKELTWDLVAGEVNNIEYKAKGYTTFFKIACIVLIIIFVFIVLPILIKLIIYISSRDIDKKEKLKKFKLFSIKNKKNNTDKKTKKE